jgi:hypothetical protein
MSWLVRTILHACSVAAVAALLLGVAVSPAGATTTGCSGGGTFTITSNVVSAGSSCVGTATIPSTVTSIGIRAFQDATGLTSVTFDAGSSLQEIRQEAFDRASGLTSIVIPSTVTSIGVRAFEDATGLTSVTFDAGSSLQAIGQEAFRSASGLTSIVIPSTVTSIGVRAFQDATGLTSVTFEGNAPTVGSDAFLRVAGGATANIGFAATGFEPVVSGQWQRLVLVRAAGPSAPAPAPAPSGPKLACTPQGPPTTGAPVTCTVSGGDAGIDILWRAAYNPVIAEEGVTLDASGSGVFSFVVPAAAVGEVITVELVEWLAPVSLGAAGGPVPTSVPAGGGPVAVWPVLLLALAGGIALRRRSRSGWPPLHLS